MNAEAFEQVLVERGVTPLWLLDAFTAEGGATRVVPRSHMDPRPLPKSMRAPASRHPEQVVVQAPAGGVLVFNGHLLHSGTQNRSARSRRVLQCQYVARELARPRVAERAAPPHWSNAVRLLMGH